MDFDEYDYLERAVDDNPKAKAEPRSSRDTNGERRTEKRSRDDERNGERRDHRDDRDRSSSRADRREKDHHRGGRDRDEHRERERDREERDRSRRHEMDAEAERGRRSSSRSRRHDREMEVEKERRSSSRSRRHDRDGEMGVDRERRSSSRSRRHDRDGEMEVDRERRSSSRSRRHDRDGEMEVDRERSRRSGSTSQRHEKELDVEMESARSRDRVPRERESERDREGRRSKDRKDAAEPEADPERDQRTVFAYQMPLKADERDVYEFFSQAGKVRDVRLIMDRNSRRSKGVGYIEFYDVMSVQAAILLSGQLFLGQPVMVKHSEAEKNLVPSSAAGGTFLPGSDRKLYVGNLHFNMTEEHLRQIFEAFGPVELVQMPLDMETGHCKGFGFVQFVQLEHAKAAQQSLNGTLEIAGRIAKVSSVTEHVGVQDSGTNATDFDDDDGGGLALNARSRALLMQKLDRTGTASSIAESLGVPVVNGTTTALVPTAKASIPMAFPTLLTSPVVEPIGDPSECVMLKNMFDPKTETDPDFDLEIKDDVQDECTKFGPLKHIYVDKNSNGFVYLRFDSIAAAINCQRAMHMRWFARRCISATFMRIHEYEAKVRSAV